MALQTASHADAELSERDFGLFLDMLEGRSVREIARERGFTESTARKYVERLIGTMQSRMNRPLGRMQLAAEEFARWLDRPIEANEADQAAPQVSIEEIAFWDTKLPENRAKRAAA